MLKDATYKEKFARLNPWLPVIIEVIKKDLRNEHLKKDWMFVKYYFPGKNVNKLTSEELVQAYKHSLESGEKIEELGEFLTNRWLLKNTDLYSFFEEELSRINPNFQELEILDSKTASSLMENAVKHFGALNTYIFSVLNSVVFPDETFNILEKRAEEESKKCAAEAKILQEKQSIDEMKRDYEQQIARLTDKYEKKLIGFQKKYHNDIDMLKKQVSGLQRKLNPVATH